MALHIKKKKVKYYLKYTYEYCDETNETQLNSFRCSVLT